MNDLAVITERDFTISNISDAQALLDSSTTIEEALQIERQSSVLHSIIAQAKDEVLEKEVARLRLRAQRRCGEFLSSNIKHKGRPKKVSSELTLSLEELGISRNDSSQWQQIAKLPDYAFKNFLEEYKVPTTSGAAKLGNKYQRFLKILRELPAQKRASLLKRAILGDWEDSRLRKEALGIDSSTNTNVNGGSSRKSPSHSLRDINEDLFTSIEVEINRVDIIERIEKGIKDNGRVDDITVEYAEILLKESKSKIEKIQHIRNITAAIADTVGSSAAKTAIESLADSETEENTPIDRLVDKIAIAAIELLKINKEIQKYLKEANSPANPTSIKRGISVANKIASTAGKMVTWLVAAGRIKPADSTDEGLSLDEDW